MNQSRINAIVGEVTTFRDESFAREFMHAIRSCAPVASAMQAAETPAIAVAILSVLIARAIREDIERRQRNESSQFYDSMLGESCEHVEAVVTTPAFVGRGQRPLDLD